MAKRPTGFVFYTGISPVDGSPIVGIVTGVAKKSANPKTGDMLQTWILRMDKHPSEAMNDGSDDAICGNCIHRKNLETGKRSCYVNPMGPASVYKSFLKGNYPVIDWSEWNTLVADRKLRMGSYGDPAMIPVAVWDKLLVPTSGHTGYTHQWRQDWFDIDLGRLVMASADNLMDYIDATELGLRTFRVTRDSSQKQDGELVCPSSAEAGKKTTCQACSLCDGNDRNAKNIVINVHGNGAKHATVA